MKCYLEITCCSSVLNNQNSYFRHPHIFQLTLLYYWTLLRAKDDVVVVDVVVAIADDVIVAVDGAVLVVVVAESVGTNGFWPKVSPEVTVDVVIP